jgi:hypothetical protein
VPIPGSTVEIAGLRFTAEETKGRRNRVGTVLITPVTTPEAWQSPHEQPSDSERPTPARSQRSQRAQH